MLDLSPYIALINHISQRSCFFACQSTCLERDLVLTHAFTVALSVVHHDLILQPLKQGRSPADLWQRKKNPFVIKRVESIMPQGHPIDDDNLTADKCLSTRRAKDFIRWGNTTYAPQCGSSQKPIFSRRVTQGKNPLIRYTWPLLLFCTPS